MRKVYETWLGHYLVLEAVQTLPSPMQARIMPFLCALIASLSYLPTVKESDVALFIQLHSSLDCKSPKNRNQVLSTTEALMSMQPDIQ